MNSIVRLGFCSIVALLFLTVLTAGAQGISNSANPTLSADGRYAAFDSSATNLVSGDTNGMRDIFVRDRAAGATYLVSKNSTGAQGNSNSYKPSISADGRYVAFDSSATNLVSGDTNGKSDVFVRDRAAGVTYLVSKNSTGAQGNGYSNIASISADGRYVAFVSAATNLVSGDINGMTDIFVRDRAAGAIYLVSKNSSGVLGNGDSYGPSFSSDGRYMTFDSVATNLVSGDTNGARDIFMRDRAAGATYLVSKK
jgi:Tol biopolymer transport system component